MSNLDEIRLADFVLAEPKKTSFFVENQFPSIYRKNGQELIELVKSYYRFLEDESNQSIYNIRRIYDYRNIDTTLERMLLFFKNKFLNGLFFDKDIRFVVKNILDLYRRKGSKEGIELFFRLFFEEDIEVFFPSNDLFKPSQSTFKQGRYLQLNTVTNIDRFANSSNKKIFGSISEAEAFIDTVLFINIRDSIVPIIFISNVKGNFEDFEVIFSVDPFISYGTVFGSLNSVDVEKLDTGNFSAENRVGDFVDILSTTEGVGAKGRILSVSEDISGAINFTIQDGGFAYTIATVPGDPNHSPFSDTEIFISEQSIFFDNPNQELILEEKVRQINSSNTEVIGIVIGQSIESIGIILDKTAPDFGEETFIFESGFNIETIDRETNITREVLFTTALNSSASADVGALKNEQTLNIVIDIIEDFLTVELDSSDYNANNAPFSGANTVNLDTPLNEAFAPQQFTIGEISGLKNINPGSDYTSDVFILAKETLFSRFNLRDQVMNLAVTNINFFEGDIVTQQRDIEDFEGNVQTVTIKGRVVQSIGNNIFVKQLVFDPFISSKVELVNGIPTVVPIPIFKEGSSTPVFVNSISRDSNSRPAGLNSKIIGTASFFAGKIDIIDVIDSGFGYNKDETVFILNTDKKKRLEDRLAVAISEGNQEEIETIQILLERIELNKDAFGSAIVGRQGITEGNWISFESHTNQEKVIQDSFFYQDYSYEISTSIPQSVFEDTYLELIHPVGMKFFSKFSKSALINIDTQVNGTIFTDFDDDIDLSGIVETANTGFNYLISEE